MNKALLAETVALLLAIAGLAYAYLQPEGSTVIVFAGRRLSVSLANTQTQQEQGLSRNPSMAEDQGMLFVFSAGSLWGFWMKGMGVSSGHDMVQRQ